MHVKNSYLKKQKYIFKKSILFSLKNFKNKNLPESVNETTKWTCGFILTVLMETIFEFSLISTMSNEDIAAASIQAILSFCPMKINSLLSSLLGQMQLKFSISLKFKIQCYFQLRLVSLTIH